MTLIKSEIREPYITKEPPAVTVIEPRWELTPAPEPALDIFAADLVIETAVKRYEALCALEHNGKAALGAYLDADELHNNAVAFYCIITTTMDGYEDEECQLP